MTFIKGYHTLCGLKALKYTTLALIHFLHAFYLFNRVQKEQFKWNTARLFSQSIWYYIYNDDGKNVITDNL